MNCIFHTGGIRSVNVDFPDSDMESAVKAWKNYVNDIPAYPGNFEGKGIVICAGGIHYFTCCWVLLNVLRKYHKCTLPVQIWYAGNELTQSAIDALKEIGASCHNFLDYENDFELKGWMLKPLAIKLSSFKEVLFLDADNIPVVNPEFLFQSPGYKESGAMFWPDFWQTDNNNPIWQITGHEPVTMKEQESGQLLIDKEKCWREINLTVYFNRNSFIYYNLLLGDKDTFRFAWMALKSGFHFISHEVASCGYVNFGGIFLGHTMVQHSPDGQICFLHRNLLKWSETSLDSVSWAMIKQFKKDAVDKQYIRFRLNNGHLYMNLEGDVETFVFRDLFGDMENLCLKYLRDLRKSRLYQDFVLSFY
jgi:alpha 1,2-mannosyltransferase